MNVICARVLATAVLCSCVASGCSKTSSGDAASASPLPSLPDSAATAAAENASPAPFVQTAAPAPAGFATPYPNVVPTVSVAYADLTGDLDAPGIAALGKLGVLDATSGAFKPNDPCKRRDFVRWLFKANNVLFGNTAGKVIHPGAADETPAFKDLPASDPDFAYVQGMADAGISVGFPDRTFRPNDAITREQAVAIKSILDHGGLANSFAGSKNVGFARYTLPQWKDRGDVAVAFVGAVAQDAGDEGAGKIDNIGRTFGAIAVFKPRSRVSRGQAATMLNVIGGHTDMMAYADATRSTDQIFAAEAAASASAAAVARGR